MSDIVTNLPFHDWFHVTAIYGQEGPNWSLGFHTGIDLVAMSDLTIYSTCSGVVISNGYSNAYGYNVFIQDNEKGYFHHFCHMQAQSSLIVGQNVDRNTVIGTMGATGNVTGPHLHYELMQNSTAFEAENFLDPTIWLGIPNETGLYNYEDYPVSGDIPEPEPDPEEKKKKRKYKFVLFKKR